MEFVNKIETVNLTQPDLNGAHPEKELAMKRDFGIAGVEGGKAAQK